MRTIVGLLFVAVSASFASTAAAQREPMIMVAVEAHPVARASVAPHLADDAMELHAPDAGDYVLPVVGVVLGGAATLAGVVFVLGSTFVLALHDDSPSNAGIWLGGSAAVAVVGALTLGLSIAQLRNLHHRASDAEQSETGVQVIQFTPSASGAVVTVAGTF